MSARHRVLMIAPYFPPRLRVGALRPYKLALDLPAQGWAPSVVHLATPNGPAPIEGLDQLPRCEIGSPVDRTAARGGSSLGPRRSGRGWLDRADDLVPVDGWLLPVLWAGRTVLRFARAQMPDVVWSTADPWSSHVLAARVARRLGRPWVADFRDPWTLCRVRSRLRPGWVRRVDRRVEAAVLAQANRIVFTSEATRRLYADAHPEHAARMRVVTNGFRGPVRPLSTEPTQAPRLVLRFFGRFRPLSSAARIIRVLAELRRLDPEALAELEVRSVGGLDEEDARRATEAGVRDHFVAEDAVSPEAAPDRLAASDLLLLSAEPGREEILPAKLFDYLAAGRPVFSLADSPEVASILHQTGVGLQFGRNADVLAAGYLARAVRAHRAGAPIPDVGPARPEVIERWSSPAVARRMARVLEEALSSPPVGTRRRSA